MYLILREVKTRVIVKTFPKPRVLKPLGERKSNSVKGFRTSVSCKRKKVWKPQNTFQHFCSNFSQVRNSVSSTFFILRNAKRHWIRAFLFFLRRRNVWHSTMTIFFVNNLQNAKSSEFMVRWPFFSSFWRSPCKSQKIPNLCPAAWWLFFFFEDHLFLFRST